MQSWPNSLPDPVFPEIEEQGPISSFVETHMDVGPAKRRGRSSIRRRPFALVYAPVSESVCEDFRDWFDLGLEGGIHMFSMAHPVSGALKSWRFPQDEPYAIVPIGEDAFQISVTLEMIG